MKRTIALVLSVCASVILTVMLASSIAQAQCSDLIIGTGGVSCSLTGSDANYCYYDCDCGNTGSQCCARMADMGVECIEDGPHV